MKGLDRILFYMFILLVVVLLSTLIIYSQSYHITDIMNRLKSKGNVEVSNYKISFTCAKINSIPYLYITVNELNILNKGYRAIDVKPIFEFDEELIPGTCSGTINPGEDLDLEDCLIHGFEIKGDCPVIEKEKFSGTIKSDTIYVIGSYSFLLKNSMFYIKDSNGNLKASLNTDDYIRCVNSYHPYGDHEEEVEQLKSCIKRAFNSDDPININIYLGDRNGARIIDIVSIEYNDLSIGIRRCDGNIILGDIAFYGKPSDVKLFNMKIGLFDKKKMETIKNVKSYKSIYDLTLKYPEIFLSSYNVELTTSMFVQSYVGEQQ